MQTIFIIIITICYRLVVHITDAIIGLQHKSTNDQHRQEQNTLTTQRHSPIIMQGSRSVRVMKAI